MRNIRIADRRDRVGAPLARRSGTARSRVREWLATAPIFLVTLALIVPFIHAEASAGVATIEATPSSIAAGSSIVVSGSGFQRGVTGQIVLDGGTRLGKFSAGRTGAFKVKVSIPGSVPVGAHHVDAKVATGIAASTAIQVLEARSTARNGQGSKAQASAAPTAEPTATAIATSTPTPTQTPDATATAASTPDPTPTAMPDPTPTATPDPTAGPTPTATPDPTGTPNPTATPNPTPTPTPKPTPTPTPKPTPTPTPKPTPTPTPTPTPAPVDGTIVPAGTGLAAAVANLPSSGGTLVLRGGNHIVSSPITTSKSFKMLAYPGETPVITHGSARPDFLYLRGGPVLIKGITFRTGASSPTFDDSMGSAQLEVESGGHDVTVDDVTFIGTSAMSSRQQLLYIASSLGPITVVNSTFIGGGTDGSGLHLYHDPGPKGVTAKANSFQGFAYEAAILVDQLASGIMIDSNTISSSNIAIQYRKSLGAVVRNNHGSGNHIGLQLISTTNLTQSNNAL